MKNPTASKLLSIIPFALAIFLLVSIASCNKDERNCIAGKGKGGIEITVFPVYNGLPVASSKAFKDTVLVKYGTTNFPGDNQSKYELHVIAKEGEKSAVISKINCGVYYIFVICQDTVSGRRLTGGASFVSDKINGEFNLVIPVSAN